MLKRLRSVGTSEKVDLFCYGHLATKYVRINVCNLSAHQQVKCNYMVHKCYSARMLVEAKAKEEMKQFIFGRTIAYNPTEMLRLIVAIDSEARSHAIAKQ